MNTDLFPQFVSHKVVRAMRIVRVTPLTVLLQYPGSDEDAPAISYPVNEPLFSRYTPVPGDFLLFYPDGYVSPSPRAAFLEGYSPMPTVEPAMGVAMRKIEVGSVVLFRVPKDKMTNGAEIAPAIVTRAWTEKMVNLTVFPDYGEPYVQGSVSESETEPRSWFWPPLPKLEAIG